MDQRMPQQRAQTQSILKKINPEYSLKGLIMKLQYFGHLMQRASSLEKTLIVGDTEGRRRRGWQRMRWLNGTIESMDISLSKLLETVKNWIVWHAVVHGVAKSRTRLSDWTTTLHYHCSNSLLLKMGHKLFITCQDISQLLRIKLKLWYQNMLMKWK